jgi:hypothetical protein
LFVEDGPQEVFLNLQIAATPASPPSLPWSNLHLTDRSTASEEPNTLLSTYRGPQFDTSLLIHNFRDLSLETVRSMFVPKNKLLSTSDMPADEIFRNEIKQ